MRHRVLREMARNIRLRRADRSLFTDDEWNRLAPRLREHTRELARIDGWQWAVSLVLGCIFVTASLAAFIASNIVFRWRDPNHSLFFVAGVFAMSLVTAWIFFALMAAPIAANRVALFFGSSRFYTWMSAMIGTGYAMAAVRLLLDRTRALPTDGYIAGISVMTAALWGLIMLIASAMSLAVQKYFGARRLQTRTEAVAVDAFLQIAKNAARVREDGDVLLINLEDAGEAIGKHFPRSIRARDEATATWTTTQFEQMACAIRDLKKLVIIPQPDSAERLRGAAHHTIVALLDRDWYAIPRLEAASGPSKRSVVMEILRGVRMLVIAVAPVTVLALFHTSLETYVDAQVLKSAFTAAYVWAGIGLMMVVDPDFTAKLTGAHLPSFKSGE